MMVKGLKEKSMDLSLLAGKIKDLSPLSILQRGYSITRKLPGKTILKDVSALNRGDNIHITLAEGEIESRVEKITAREE